LEQFLLGAVWAICFVLMAAMLWLARQTLQSIDLWEERLRERQSMRRWLRRRGLGAARRRA
jgi:hypothetical protein